MLLKGTDKGILEKSCVFQVPNNNQNPLELVGRKPFDTFFLIVVIAYKVTLEV